MKSHNQDSIFFGTEVSPPSFLSFKMTLLQVIQNKYLMKKKWGDYATFICFYVL